VILTACKSYGREYYINLILLHGAMTGTSILWSLAVMLVVCIYFGRIQLPMVQIRQ